MKRALISSWQKGPEAAGPFSLFLYALSLPYKLGVRGRNFCYDRGVIPQLRLPCPVISVGNITVGGTGKTPLVVMLARELRDRGYNPAVLTRGYGGAGRGPLVLTGAREYTTADCQAAGEEAVLMARSLAGIPIIVGPKRVRTGRLACEDYQADLVILDDGFQHRRLGRDLDIVLLDGERPLANGHLLPRGELREGADSLARAHVIVYTGTKPDRPPAALPESVSRKLRIPVFTAWRRPVHLQGLKDGQVYPLEFMSGKKVSLFCGIGSPENFRKTVSSLGAEVVASLYYPDHHRYGPEDMGEIKALFAKAGAELIVTTEKDGVKLADYRDLLPQTFVLPIELEIVDRQGFLAYLISRLEERMINPGHPLAKGVNHGV